MPLDTQERALEVHRGKPEEETADKQVLSSYRNITSLSCTKKQFLRRRRRPSPQAAVKFDVRDGLFEEEVPGAEEESEEEEVEEVLEQEGVTNGTANAVEMTQ